MRKYRSIFLSPSVCHFRICVKFLHKVKEPTIRFLSKVVLFMKKVYKGLDVELFV